MSGSAVVALAIFAPPMLSFLYLVYSWQARRHFFARPSTCLGKNDWDTKSVIWIVLTLVWPVSILFLGAAMAGKRARERASAASIPRAVAKKHRDG